GSTSSRRADLSPVIPASSPNCETKPLRSGRTGDQSSDSLRRAMSRETCSPHTCAPCPEAALLKRSCERGMRNSAVHPALSTFVAASHTASHPESSLLSLEWKASFCTPAGFTEKRKAVRLSL